MNIKRDWATPITIGAFLLSAVTGVLLFFHLDSGLNKFAHEWLSWVLLAGVALHVAGNFSGFKRHFGRGRGRALVGVFAALLLLSFIQVGGKRDGPAAFAAIQSALADAPASTLAQVAKVSPEQMLERMRSAGLPASSADQSLGELDQGDSRKQMEILGGLLRKP